MYGSNALQPLNRIGFLRRMRCSCRRWRYITRNNRLTKDESGRTLRRLTSSTRSMVIVTIISTTTPLPQKYIYYLLNAGWSIYTAPAYYGYGSIVFNSLDLSLSCHGYVQAAYGVTVINAVFKLSQLLPPYLVSIWTTMY